VVPTHNRIAMLQRLVDALLDQDLDEALEVVIVDDGSSDNTSELMERLVMQRGDQLVYRRIDPPQGPAAARNLGWRIAKSDSIAFTDDDCVPHRGWARAIRDGLRTSEIVQGRTLPDPTQADRWGPFSRSVHITGPSGFYETCNIGYRRALLERLDGFDRRFRMAAGEDTDLAWRALDGGATATFRQDALVYHSVFPSSFRAYIENVARWPSVVEVAYLHEGLRNRFPSGPFWRPNQRHAALGTLGLIMASAGVLIWDRRALAVLALVLPYVHFRWARRKLPGPRFRSVAAIPLALIADVYEAVVHLRAVARHRSLDRRTR
ncbi:MAG: glycosyltransferase, partial [Actinomycetota bacterium]